MNSSTFNFFVACLAAALLTPLVRRLCLKLGMIEGNNAALKVHDGAVPRLGGIAVVVAFFTPLLGLFVLGAGGAGLLSMDLQRFLAFTAGGVVIFALGLWDDLVGAGATVKFTVETLVAAGVWLAGFRIEGVNLPFIGPLDLGPVSLLVTVLWIVGITNALNLVDGLDGLASGVALFAAVAHVVIGLLNANMELTLLSAALAGAVLGFLPFNFHPARIFLGDSGALFLGYALAMASMYGANHKGGTAVAVLGPILILGFPILDTVLAMVRRVVQGRPMFDGDREHVHHRLLHLGLSQRRSMWLLYGLCAAFALAGLSVTAINSRATAVVLVALLLMLTIFERRLGIFRQSRNGRTITVPTLELLRRLRDDVRSCQSLDDVWSTLTTHAQAFSFYRMRLVHGPGDDDVLEWRRPGMAGRAREGQCRFRISVGARQARGRWPALLEVEKRPLRRSSRETDDLFSALLEEYLAEWPESEAGQEAVQLGAKRGQSHVALEPPPKG